MEIEIKRTNPKVFGSSAFGHSNPLDGEMGPYPLSDQNPLDGEMGPYPLSDNTNLLGSSSFGVPLYRNYGSNYGTNYTSTNSYVYPTRSTRYRYDSQQQCVITNCSGSGSYSGGGGGGATTQACNYGVDCGGKKMSKTPVPTRRHSAKRERDSFRRHSAHGRISTQGINYNMIKTVKTLRFPISFTLNLIIIRIISYRNFS